MLIPVILLLVGVVLLYFGSEWLVKGASLLAVSLGISPVVVGLTIVAMGTSAPELITSLYSQLFANEGNVVIGNVIGSNIYNVGLVLGLAAIITQIQVHSDIIRREAPIAIAVTVLMLAFMWNYSISRWEGAILFILFLGYVYLQIRLARSAKKHDSFVKEMSQELEKELKEEKQKSPLLLSTLILVGITGIGFGSFLLIENAMEIARYFGLSTGIIGLTIVALGTSLPELTTTLVAAFKKEVDLAVGNIVGSNIFNILLILGATALTGKVKFDPYLLQRDGLFMLAIILLMMIFIIIKKKIIHWHGALLFLSCIAYLYFVARV
ncbi:MAG: calcium/sodium antiporter [Deltaproteobacteria bacterium]|nr:calcium/sodium antiporter [Deltaproteobacteria bacterium]